MEEKPLVTSLTPRAERAGLRYTAIVMAKNVILQMQMGRMKTNYTAGRIETSYFDDIDKAKAWLKTAV